VGFFIDPSDVEPFEELCSTKEDGKNDDKVAEDLSELLSQPKHPKEYLSGVVTASILHLAVSFGGTTVQ